MKTIEEIITERLKQGESFFVSTTQIKNSGKWRKLAIEYEFKFHIGDQYEFKKISNQRSA